MENGIDETLDRSSSPTPFLGFSPSEVEVREETEEVPESPTVRVSQPRTTKSRASLVWQKNGRNQVGFVKEEVINQFSPSKKPVKKEKSNSVTSAKQKPMKNIKPVQKETIKMLKDVKESSKEKVNVEPNTLHSSENAASTSNTEIGQNAKFNLIKKKRRRFKNTNVNGFKCNQCGRVYKYIRGMRQHQKLECNVAPQFPCPYCPSHFRYRQGIREHVRVHHELAFPKWYATHYVVPMLKKEDLSQ